MSIFAAIFPHPIPFRTLEELSARSSPEQDNERNRAAYNKALSDFTRVVDQTGILRSDSDKIAE